MTTAAAATGLRGPRLVLARAMWVVVVALVLGLSLANIRFQAVYYATVCKGPACPADRLSAVDLTQLAQAGMSPGFYSAYLVTLNTLFTLLFVAVGALIFWRRARDGFGIFTAITLALIGYTISFGGSSPPAIVGSFPLLYGPIEGLAVAGDFTLFLFFYLFPDGHFVPRWVAWLVPLVLVHEILLGFRPEWLGADWYIYPEVLSVIVVVIYRYMRFFNAIQRQQTKWVVLGSGFTGIGVLVLNTLFSLVYPNSSSAGVPLMLSNTAWSLCMLFIPLSIGMAILRSHLWDIDILIRRTLVYASLTAVLALIYFGSVILLQGLLTLITGQSSAVAEVVSTLAIAAAFFPLRRRIQSFIDRRFYRSKYDAAKTLATFAATARDETDLDRLAERLVSVVDETMQPESVGLWLSGPADGGRPRGEG